MNTLNVLRWLVIAFAVIIVVLLGVLMFAQPTKAPVTGRAANSAPIVSPDGHVAIDEPGSGDVVHSPVVISGTVTEGGWFFEASFPITVLDGDGTPIGQGTARPTGDQSLWMSTGTVPFSASISFTAPRYPTGTIVLSKDNPSASPVNDEHVSILVRFTE